MEDETVPTPPEAVVTPSPSNTEPDLPDRSQSSTDQPVSTGLQSSTDQSSTNPPSSTDPQSSTDPHSSTDQQSSTPSSYTETNISSNTETNISSNTETPPTVKQSDVSSNNKSENPGNFSQGSSGSGSEGSAEIKKYKQKESTNRLYKPTAASEAKSKQVPQGRPQKAPIPSSMKPPPPTARRGPRPGVRGLGRGTPPLGRGVAQGTLRRGRGRGTRPANIVENENQKRERTPDTNAKVPCRGASTPTGDPASDTVLEAWDASEIVTVNTTRVSNLLDETTIAPPRQALQFTKPGARSLNATIAGGPARQPRTAVKRPQTAVKTARKPGLASARKPLDPAASRDNNAVFQNTVLEDPDEITDEMLEIAWCRYVQSEFIKRRSKKALQQAEKECERKLLAAWKLLEQTRQEVLKLEEDLVLANIISDIQDMLESVGPLFGEEGGLLGNLEETTERLDQLSNGLEAVKHNIEVKGVNIEVKERDEVAHRLLDLFSKFNAGSPDIAQLVDKDTLHSMQDVERYRELGEGIQRRCKENTALVNCCRTLAVKEASLRISLQEIAPSGQPTLDVETPPLIDIQPPSLPPSSEPAMIQSNSAAAL